MNDTSLSGSCINVPQYKSQMVINGGLTIHFQQPKPNWFWRFWHRAFFGFIWKELK